MTMQAIRGMSTKVLKSTSAVFYLGLTLACGNAAAETVTMTYTGSSYNQIAPGSMFGRISPTTGQFELSPNPEQNPHLNMRITFNSAAVTNNILSADKIKSFSFSDGGGFGRSWTRKELKQYNALCPTGTSPCFKLGGNINFLPNSYNVSSWQLGYKSDINSVSSSASGDITNYSLPRSHAYTLSSGTGGKWVSDTTLAPIPIPASLPLMISGLLGCYLFRRKVPTFHT